LIFVISGTIIFALTVLVSLSRHYRNFIAYKTEAEEKESMAKSGIYYRIRYLEPGEIDLDDKE